MTRRKRALFFCVTAVLTLALVEAMARATFHLAYGAGYESAHLAAVLPSGPRRSPPDRLGRPFRPDRVIHPFYGYSSDRPDHDLNRMPPPRRRDGAIVIGLLGGSLAKGAAAAVERAVKAHFSGDSVGIDSEVVHLAWSGMKQPQQLMIAANMLMLGGEFDMIVNLDGVNEIMGPTRNHNAEVFPFFPNYWEELVQATTEELLLIGRIDTLRYRQHVLLRIDQLRISRWSAVIGLVVRYAFETQESTVRDLHRRLLETTSGYSLERHGPKVAYGSDEQMRRAAAENWYRASILLASLAQANGAEYYHFLQPNQYVPASKPLTDEEMENAYSSGSWLDEAVRKTYPLMVRLGAELKKDGVGFHDLTRIFSDSRETLYNDRCCHLNERGNELLAEEMLRRIVETSRNAAFDPEAHARTGSSAPVSSDVPLPSGHPSSR